jgi:F-box/WD-40 domain protein MET30
LLSGENEDDTSSTSSGPSLAHKHSHHPATTSADTVVPFWPDEPERPAPPRYMLTGALDSTIRLWDVHSPAVSPAVDAANPIQKPPTTNACLRTYFGHVEGIWALAADHLRMVSGSEDRTVKIWDPRSGKCERTWTGHAGPVTCIGLSDSRLVSGSEDCEVRMLLFNTGEGSEGCEEQ